MSDNGCRDKDEGIIHCDNCGHYITRRMPSAGTTSDFAARCRPAVKAYLTKAEQAVLKVGKPDGYPEHYRKLLDDDANRARTLLDDIEALIDGKQPVPSTGATHTDHPLRHFDRIAEQQGNIDRADKSQVSATSIVDAGATTPRTDAVAMKITKKWQAPRVPAVSAARHFTERCEAYEALIDKSDHEHARDQWRALAYDIARSAPPNGREPVAHSDHKAVALDVAFTLFALLDRNITFDGRDARLSFESHDQAINHVGDARRKAQQVLEPIK